MSAPNIAREDTFEVTVTIDGRDFGVWEGRSGGAGDSEETKTRLGGMGPEVSLGGPQTMENLTIKKLFDLDGIANDLPWLFARRGKADVTVNNQPLDKDGNRRGRRWTYTGTLKAVTPPDYDHKGNDESFIECEIVPNGVIA